MAGGSLLLLLDDIAAVLDDVALMTKVAAKKTVAVMGDDLAVNAEKVTACALIESCRLCGLSQRARCATSAS